MIERQPSWVDESVREIAIDIHPAVMRYGSAGNLGAARIPESFTREIVIVGFHDDARTPGDGLQIADVLARIGTGGAESAKRVPSGLLLADR